MSVLLAAPFNTEAGIPTLFSRFGELPVRNASGHAVSQRADVLNVLGVFYGMVELIRRVM